MANSDDKPITLACEAVLLLHLDENERVTKMTIVPSQSSVYANSVYAEEIEDEALIQRLVDKVNHDDWPVIEKLPAEVDWVG